MKVAVVGKGRMGQLIAQTAQEHGHEVVAMADIFNKEEVMPDFVTADVVLDFSHPDNLSWILEAIDQKNIALVEGTTNFTPKQLESLKEASKTNPIFFSANYSLGIAVLKRLCAIAAQALNEGWDMEIIEKHHNKKADAPSGTALALLEAIDPNNEYKRVFGRSGTTGPRQKEIGIHAVRGGSVPGDHEVLFLSQDESLSLAHHANSRQIFVNGAIQAAEFMNDKPAGLYDMTDLV